MRIFWRLLILSVSVLLTACSTTVISEEARSNIALEFCHFRLDEALKRSNASFYLVFRFEVDSSGSPKNLDIQPTKFVSAESIQKCVQKWSFPRSLKGKTLTAVQSWQHGHGWKQLGISGVDPTITIKSSGDQEPYP